VSRVIAHDGKEGVDGSSPLEGFVEALGNPPFGLSIQQTAVTRWHLRGTFDVRTLFAHGRPSSARAAARADSMTLSARRGVIRIVQARLTLRPCDRRLEVDRVSDVDGIRWKRDNSRIAVQAPAAILVKVARTRVLFQHP
jgi:hypothetical protein